MSKVDCDTVNSIQKLRKLREKLCDQQSQWKKAFEVKDAVVDQLKKLKEDADNPEVAREDIVSKIDNLLILIDPDRQKELENSNV